MRMWMVDPTLLCRKHLLGEHVECGHMLTASLREHRDLAGFVARVQLQPADAKARHDALATEMVRRGYRHNSPAEQPDVSYLPVEQQTATVDTDASLRELARRCPECRARIEGW